MKTLLFLIPITLLIASCSNNTKKAKAHFEKAKFFYEAENFNLALLEIDSALKAEKSNTDFIITKSKILCELNYDQEAIDILLPLENNIKNSDSIMFNIGMCYYQYGYKTLQGQNKNSSANLLFNKAVIYFNNTIAKNKHFFQAYEFKGRALHNLEHFDEALVEFNNGLNIFSDSIRLISLRGIEKIYLGDLTGSLIDLNLTIKSNQLNKNMLATSLRFRGVLYHKMKNYNQAINDFTKSIELNPKEAYTFVNRGNCYKENNQKESACQDFRKAADLGDVTIYETIKNYCNSN